MLGYVYVINKNVKKVVYLDKVYREDEEGNEINFDIENHTPRKVYYHRICSDKVACKEKHKHKEKVQVLVTGTSESSVKAPPENRYKLINNKFVSSTELETMESSSSADSYDDEEIVKIHDQRAYDNHETEAEQVETIKPCLKRKRVSNNNYL